MPSKVNLFAIRHQAYQATGLLCWKHTSRPRCADLRSHASTNRRPGPRSGIVASRRILRPPLNQDSVSIKQQLRIVECPAIAFVHSDGRLHFGVLVGLPTAWVESDGTDCDLVERSGMLLARFDFVRCPGRRQIRNSISGKGGVSLLPI